MKVPLLKRQQCIIYGLFLGLLIIPQSICSQQQPQEAMNNQDETVNINKMMDADTEKLTIFRSGDKAEVNHYISEVFELKKAVALEILPHITKAVKLEKGTARALKYTDPDAGRDRYYIQVVTTVEQMPSIRKTVEALDLPKVVSSEGSMKYHRRMKYRRASEVADIIAGTVLSSEGSIFADDVTNTVYIKDAQSEGEREIVTLEFYDVPPPQVEFEILAVEILDDNEAKLGLDWDAWKIAMGGQIIFADKDFDLTNRSARKASFMTLDPIFLASFLNYTTQTGTSKVITRTKITASNNTPAVVSSLRRLESLTYQTTYQGTPVSVTNPFTNNVLTTTLQGSRSFLVNRSPNASAPGTSAVDPSLTPGEKAEGVYLFIRPNIGTDMVTAHIRIVVNSLSGYTKVNEPIITERLIDTMVTLQNGQTFSLGALDKETFLNERSGIPGLKNIRVIKYLFSVEREVIRHSKIYMVITPTFKNQVLFNSVSLNSTTFDTTPPVKVNTDIETLEITDIKQIPQEQ